MLAGVPLPKRVRLSHLRGPEGFLEELHHGKVEFRELAMWERNHGFCACLSLLAPLKPSCLGAKALVAEAVLSSAEVRQKLGNIQRNPASEQQPPWRHN